MKKTLLVLLVSLLCCISIKTVSAQDVEISDLLEPKQQELVKVALEADSLTVFLVDTSGNMQNKDKQTTIQLITRFAQESDGSNIAVITYGATAQVLVEPTRDPNLIQEKLRTLTSAGESNLSAGLLATKEMMAGVKSSKTNLFIIADSAPTAGEKMKQGAYKSQDNYNYQYANAVDDFAEQFNKSKLSIRTLIYLSRVAKSTQPFTQRFFENIQTDGFFDISQSQTLDFLFEHEKVDETLLSGQFSYGVAVGERDGQAQFHYSDQYFEASSLAFQNEVLPYHPSLATMSLNLELSAWASPSQSNYLYKSDNAKNLLKKIGFEEFEANDGFKFKPTQDSIGAVIAQKKLTVGQESYTLIALAIRGGGYEAEWASNVTLGGTGQHQGFETASQEVFSFLETYLITHQIKGNIKLWLTGYSRGAAIANLIAGALNRGKKMPQVTLAPKDLYAFCFEPPAGTLASFDAKHQKQANIINIINLNDVVTKVAPNAGNFAFTRYGNDVNLPTKETHGDNQYYLLRDRMLRELDKLETQKGYNLEAFKRKKLSLAVGIGTNSMWRSVVDNSEDHILNDYLNQLISTFTIEELKNRDYYVTHHQESMRDILSALLARSENKEYVTASELSNLLLDLKQTAGLGLLMRPLERKIGQFLGFDDLTSELNSSVLELIGDFIIKHPNLSLTLLENSDIILSAHQPELCLAWMRSQDKNYTEPVALIKTRATRSTIVAPKNYYQTTVVVDGEVFGTILGGGVTLENNQAELYAIPFENGQFEGWFKGDTLISKDLACEYTVTGESTLVAKFSANKGGRDDS